ncbi:MAG: HlyD family efflux transporter periplasmic adaptor subunit [Steroidobacteraceae bacterium]
MSTTPAEMQSANGSRRQRFLTILLVIVLAVGALVAAYYLMFVRGYVATENAYVNGNIVQVTAQTGGTIIAVNADETDAVTAGSALVNLDPVDAKVMLARAENALARSVREIRGTFASTEGLNAFVKARQADVARARAEVARATQDVERRVALAGEGGVSAEELAHARSALVGAEASLSAALAGAAEAGQNLTANEARIEGSVVATNPVVLQAAAELKEAYIAFKRTTVLAPATGIIAKRGAQLGARVQPGQMLATIVPLKEIWVDANFKEAQLATLRIGQPVTLEADFYGSSVEYHGKVAGLGAGTGSAFSVLPAQNATGNWIKVVQRVPVRIALDPAELEAHPLRIGLSMAATVDTRDESGEVLAGQPATQSRYSTTVYDGIEAEADTYVQQVITANLPARQARSTMKPAARTASTR